MKTTISSVPAKDMDGRDDLGNTLLLLAIMYKVGKDRSNWSPISKFESLFHQAHDTMEQLVSMGADVNARNFAG